MPSNDYYDNSAAEERFLEGETARGTDVDAKLDSVQSGFDKLPSESDLKEGKVALGVDSGTANAYVVAMTYAPAAYSEGLKVSFKVGNGNTGPSTINVDGLGTKTIVRPNGSGLKEGDLPEGYIVSMSYNGTEFRIDTPLINSTLEAENSASAALASQQAAEEAMALAATFASEASLKGGRKNFLINGDFSIWERGSLFAGPANEYTADRWYYYDGPDSNSTVSQSSTKSNSPYSLVDAGKITIDQADTPYAAMMQLVENGSFLSGKVVTAQLSTYQSVGSGQEVELQIVRRLKSDSNSYPNIEVLHSELFSLTGNWQTFATNFSVPYDDDRDDYYYGFRFVYFTPALNDEFIFTAAQIEIGSEASAFDKRSDAEEIALCQRYFTHLLFKESDNTSVLVDGYWSGSTYITRIFTLPTKMRDTPTVSCSYGSTLELQEDPVGLSQSPNYVSARARVTSGGTKRAYFYLYSLTADAEL